VVAPPPLLLPLLPLPLLLPPLLLLLPPPLLPAPLLPPPLLLLLLLLASLPVLGLLLDPHAVARPVASPTPIDTREKIRTFFIRRPYPLLDAGVTSL
jgi:hypothetical protein